MIADPERSPASRAPSRRALLILLGILILAAAVRVPLVFAGAEDLPRSVDEPFLVLSAVELPEGLRPLGLLTYPGGPPLLLTAAACVLAFLLSHAGELLGALLSADMGRLPALYELYFVEHYADPARNYVVARLVSTAAGVAGVWAVWRFGRRWAGGTAAGLAAAGLVALWPAHMHLSTVARVDIWLGLFLVLLLDESFTVEWDGERSVLPLALWTGLLVATKNNAAVALAVPVYCLWRGALPGRRLGRLARWAGWSALFAAVACPWILADPVFVLKEVARTYAALSGVSQTAGWASGLLGGPAGSIWRALGPVLLAGIAGGTAIWARRRPEVVIASFWTLVVTLLATLKAGVFFSRYLVPPAAPLAAAAGLLAVEGGRWVARRLGRNEAAGVLLGGTFLCVLMLPGAVDALRYWSGPDPRVQARSWLESNVAAGETILYNEDLGLRQDDESLAAELGWLERRYFRESTPLPVPVATEMFAMEVLYRIHALRHQRRAADLGLLEGKGLRAWPFTWRFVPDGVLADLRAGRVAYVVISPVSRDAYLRAAAAGIDSGGAAEVAQSAGAGREAARFESRGLTMEVLDLRPTRPERR